MAPPRYFGSRRRTGVSELYASMLMIGVTLSAGSLVTYGALDQFGQASGSASQGNLLQQQTAGVGLSLVFASATPLGSCGTFGGFHEGTAFTISLYDYGQSPFTPVEFLVNSTAYPGSYATAPAGGMTAYSLTLLSCAHPSGQVVVVVDSFGDEVQFES